MRVKVLQPLRHDGERQPVGSTLELPVDVAQPLIDAGTVERADLAAQSAAKAPAKAVQTGNKGGAKK